MSELWEKKFRIVSLYHVIMWKSELCDKKWQYILVFYSVVEMGFHNLIKMNIDTNKY